MTYDARFPAGLLAFNKLLDILRSVWFLCRRLYKVL